MTFQMSQLPNSGGEHLMFVKINKLIPRAPGGHLFSYHPLKLPLVVSVDNI